MFGDFMELNNIAQGIANSIKKRIGVADEATLFVSNLRKDICKECPSIKRSVTLQTDICTECGCVIALKTLSDSKCPKEKW
jgi:hypothetical protein